MRAIVLEDQAVYQDSRPDPSPGPGEVLVRVLQAGVCETDLQLIKGYMGFVASSATSSSASPKSGPLQGRRVVGEINCACQSCATCKAGLQTHCPNRTVLGILNHDGAFADASRCRK
jgi:threonine dehydrogenase-like Zn-dependent dehydrogenase